MNFPFIATLIKKKYVTPAMGRMMEAGIASLIGYLVGAAYEGKMLSVQGAVQALVTPLYMYFTKISRDSSNR